MFEVIQFNAHLHSYKVKDTNNLIVVNYKDLFNIIPVSVNSLNGELFLKV